jgi:uracil-DNA glycosylase family 4
MPELPQLSPLKRHFKQWANGCGSDQCDGARNKCFARGKVPAHVLMIGEAAGESEDVVGTVFIGPAGKLLDQMIEDAKRIADKPDLRIAFTNLVGCLPRNGDEKADEPDKDQIRSCTPRLVEFIQIVKPKLVVRVGRLSEKHAAKIVDMSKIKTPKFCSIIHPAAILRGSIALSGISVQKCVVTLASAFRELKT